MTDIAVTVKMFYPQVCANPIGRINAIIVGRVIGVGLKYCGGAMPKLIIYAITTSRLRPPVMALMFFGRRLRSLFIICVLLKGADYKWRAMTSS